MYKTTLYVVRHGQTPHNRDELLSGHVDPDLTDLGLKQAAATRDKLAHVSFDDVYSSDLQRAVKTASIIYGEPVPTHHRLSALRERSYGSIDGMPRETMIALREKHKETYDQLSDEERWRFKHIDDMESEHELAERFMAGLQQIVDENPGKTILVGAHSGTLRITLISLGHSTVTQLPSGGVFENGGFIRLTYGGDSVSVDEIDGLKEGYPLQA